MEAKFNTRHLPHLSLDSTNFACKEGICRKVAKFTKHPSMSLLERLQGHVCMSQRQFKVGIRK